MVTANDKIMVVLSQANLYDPTLQKCCYGFDLLFYFVLLKLKLSKKRETGTSHLNGLNLEKMLGLTFPSSLRSKSFRAKSNLLVIQISSTLVN